MGAQEDTITMRGPRKIGRFCFVTSLINQSEDSFNKKTGGIVGFGDSNKTQTVK